MGEERRFRAEFLRLIPILATTGLSLLFAFFLDLEGFQPFEVLPFSESGLGPLLNAGYFVVFLVGAAFFFYFLLRFRKRIFRIVVALSFFVAVFSVTGVYTSILFNSLDIDLWTVLLSLGVTVLAALAMFKLGPLAESLTLVALGSSLGALLGVLTPTISALALLLVLSLYDIYSVHRGPLGKMIAPDSLDDLRGLLLSFREIHIGLGDLVFYSLLVGHLFFNFGLSSALAAITGILVGAFTTLKLLEAEQLLPGLPISLSLGVILAFLVQSL